MPHYETMLYENDRAGKTAIAHIQELNRQGWKAGFSRIRILGHSIPASGRSDNVTDGEVSPHWRRGHYRRQPHGSGLQLRRLRWIRPVVVRPDRGDPVGGHMYEVE